MPSIPFKDFTNEATAIVDETAVNAWGQIKGGGSVWDQTPTPGVSIFIDVKRSSHRVAPEGVFFSPTLTGFATNTSINIADYDPSYHDKVYFWDYGESYDYVAPTQVVAMDASDGGNRSDSRYSLGPLGSHVFRKPGIHMVRLAVHEPSTGRWGQAYMSISVANPDDFYSGSTTIFVDQTGSYRNAPPGAQRFTSLRSAFTLLELAVTPHRLVLERGQEHVISNTLEFRPPSNANGVSMRIEAAAVNGPAPIIQASDNFSGSSIILDRSLLDVNKIDTGSVISGLDLRGTWDVTTEKGEWGLSGITFGGARAEHCLVDSCDIKNINIGIQTINLGRAERNERAYFVNDSVISDWSNYGFFDADYGCSSILGSRIAQNPDAITGGPKDKTHNNHGPYRIGSPNKTVFLSSDFFSATGWSSLGSILAVQPAIRWNTSPDMGAGAQLNIQHCVMESAGVPLAISAANNSENSRLTNSIIEGSFIIGGFNSSRLVLLSHGGVTLRNNIFVYPETQYNATIIGGQSRGPGAIVATPTNGDGNGSDMANLAAPIQIYNNTIVNLSNIGGVQIWYDAKMGFSNVNADLESNLVHEPNIGIPYPYLRRVTAFIPRYQGYRVDETTLFEEYKTAPNSASIWVPEIGSPALGAALTEPNAITDFRGNLRPDPPSAGALETD